MARQSTLLNILLVLALTLSLLSPQPPQAEAAIANCNTVLSYLSPCINFVISGAPLASNCCPGIQGLYGQANTTPDRQRVCTCIKSVAGSASDEVVQRAASLPGKCGVRLPYKISKSTDCSKIK